MTEEQSESFAMLSAQHAVIRALMMAHPNPVALSTQIEHYAESARVVLKGNLSETAIGCFEEEVKSFRDFCLQLAPASRA